VEKMKRVENARFDHSGFSFDSFLEEEGTLEAVETVAIKRVLAWQLPQAVRQQRKTKQVLARELSSSRGGAPRSRKPICA
jgi:antitoxin HicB